MNNTYLFLDRLSLVTKGAQYTAAEKVWITCGHCQHSSNTGLNMCKKIYVYVTCLTADKEGKYSASKTRKNQKCTCKQIKST
jgi:hypothetical protein